LFVAHLDPEGRAEGEASAIINPQIAVVGDSIVEGWEGCLSIPDIRGLVPRAFHINVVALDRHGKRLEFVAKDFPARVIQHETDHLDGILFFDRMRSFESLTYMEEFSRYHARHDDDE
jgi:peptide deformylase